MELKDYATEQLKVELKRRVELAKAQKAEEMLIRKKGSRIEYNLRTLGSRVMGRWKD